MSDTPWRIRTELIQGPPGPCKMLSGGAQWTPTFSGAVASHTFAVPGAKVGQSVAVGIDQVAAGTLAVGQVTSANTVTVTLFVFSGSAPTLTNLNVRVDVLVRTGDQ